MLSEVEQLELLRLACSVANLPILAGISATSTRATLQRLEQLRDLPLRAVLVRTPSYFGSQLDQVDFFSTLARESPFPVLVYQIPQYTGIRLTGKQLGDMAEHPNLIGIKDSLGDLAMLNEHSWPAHFRYYLGAAALIQPGIAAGAAGGILALANVVPELCRKLLRLSTDPATLQEARELQRRLIPLSRLLGGSRGFGLAGLKAACEFRGIVAGHPRRPLRRISASEKATIEEELRELGCLNSL